jgi:2-(1,2-epoxy-1,2-dihydrophenyl)acetyl-CoA isomerase
MTDGPLVLTAIDNGVARITLNRPARRNALVPALLEALNAALDALRPDELTAVVIAGTGRTFSSGGDVAGFAAQQGSALQEYARRTVSLLNRAILKILSYPIPVIARLEGFVTGGSAGLVFASDFVVMADDAFIAPYYVDVGFSPDGGWTALLPERIGAARASAVLLSNRHIGAGEALALGLATHVVPETELDKTVAALVAALSSKSRRSIAETKRLLMPPERRRDIERGLERELDAFVETIALPETALGMQRFLRR